MTKTKNHSEINSAWVKFLEDLRPDPLPTEPRAFITKVLGYQFLPFHRRWWEFAHQHSRSLILAPRGHGKSTILTVAFSLHRLLDNPDRRLLIVSNTAAQAQAFLREVRHHLEVNPQIQSRCGNLAGQPWTDSELCLASRFTKAKEASLTALGVMGPIISKHYDAIILDDVVDEEAARSRALRARLETWFYKELLPCLEPEGELHVLGTRYHRDDLYGRLLSAGIPHLIERAICDDDGVETALWEEKFPLALLQQKRAEAGPAIFNAQYQNDVTAMSGRLFRPEWIVLADPLPPIRKYQGVDLAIGRQDHHDYFAHVTVAEIGPGRFQVLAAHRDRLSFADQVRAIASLFARHDEPESPVFSVGVEANAYQEAMCQRLRAETTLPVVSVVQTRDKIARAMRLQGLLQTGRLIFIRSRDADLSALLEELLGFPDSDHDDLVDALGIAARLATQRLRYGDLPLRDLKFGP